MAEEDTIRITLRLPAELHGRLSSSAHKHERSLNAEIVANLDAVTPNDAPLADFLRQEAAELQILVEGAEWEFEEARKNTRAALDALLDGKEIKEEILVTLRHVQSDALARLNDYKQRLGRIKRVLGE